MAALLGSYAEALPAKVREIRELWSRVESGDDAEATRTLCRRVHSIAGTAGTFGYPLLSEIARRLEEVIGEGAGGARPESGTRQAAPGLIDALDAASRAGRAT